MEHSPERLAEKIYTRPLSLDATALDCRIMCGEMPFADMRGWGALKYKTTSPEEAAAVQDYAARRLIAAWNALAGIPTEDIERVVMIGKFELDRPR